MNQASQISREDCQRLAKSGYYSKAATAFQLILDRDGPDLRIVFDLAEVFLEQGYYSKCLDTLNRFVQCKNAINETIRPAISMLHCLASGIVTGQLHKVVQVAEDTYREVFRGNYLGDVEDAKVFVEEYYCLLLTLAWNYRLKNDSDVAEIPAKRLIPMFKILLESGRLEDAWRIALRYRHISNIPDGDRLLQEVCDHPSISHILKAKTLLSIAKYHELDEDPTKCHELYASAKTLFEACDHAYGTISVDLALAYRKAITEGYTPACEKVMTGSIKLYEILDYPAGLLQALEKLLSIAEKCHHFDTIDNTRREIEAISKRSGSYLLWIPSHIARLGIWKLRSGTEGKVIMAAKALYQELMKNDIVYLQGLAALHVSMAYYDIRDGDQALSWAEKTQVAWKGCRRIDQSQAAYYVLRAKLLLAGESQNTQPLVDLTERLVEIDLADSLDEEAALKLDALATHIFRVHGKFDGNERNLFQSLMNRIRALISRLPDRQARLRLAGLYQNSALPIVQEAEKEMDVHKYGKAIDILEEAFQLYKQESELALQAFTRQLQGVVGHSMFMKLLTRDATSARNVLENSIKWFRVAKDAFRAVNLVRQVIECSYWEALLNYDAWTVGWKSGVSVLELFYEVECQYGFLRGELSALRSLEAVSNKQRLTSNKHVRDIYRLSFQICLKEHQHSAAWAWIQSAKARSLSDLLGLGAFVPRTLLDRIRANDEAFRMFEADTALSKRIASAPSTEQFQARVDLEHLHSQMRGLPVLKELLDLHEGTSVSLFDLQEQLSRPEFKPKHGVLVLVDWVFKQDEIYMLTVKASGDPTIDILPLNVSTVQEWIRQYLVNQSGHERSIKMDDQHDGNALRQLDGLVLPLSSLSDPEDLLVFSPTGILHSIPLHALHIRHEHKSMPVIERNPVVYCASVTSFFQCSQRAIDRPTREVSWRSILAVYEPEPGKSFDRLEKEEQGNVYVLAENLSKVYHFDKLLRGAEVARSAIADVLQGSEMIIFHGHCDADENGNDILKQGLRLVGPDGTNFVYTIPEFFDLRLSASFILLLACASTSQLIKPGDEPLGLVTALLCAGAASVVGTIWPVQSATARAFAKIFLSKLNDAQTATGLDLAYAMREAVLELSDDLTKRTVYHWGPFVLHGSWVFK